MCSERAARMRSYRSVLVDTGAAFTHTHAARGPRTPSCSAAFQQPASTPGSTDAASAMASPGRRRAPVASAASVAGKSTRRSAASTVREPNPGRAGGVSQPRGRRSGGGRRASRRRGDHLTVASALPATPRRSTSSKELDQAARARTVVPVRFQVTDQAPHLGHGTLQLLEHDILPRSSRLGPGADHHLLYTNAGRSGGKAYLRGSTGMTSSRHRASKLRRRASDLWVKRSSWLHGRSMAHRC